MIRLTRIGMVNWHQFPPHDIDVASNVALIGENRSGKSTLLDLIQTVMSGNSGRSLELNARAGGGQRRSRRTVHSYILGRVGDGDAGRKRDEALCTIFLVFERLDGWPVTLGVVMEARATEAREQTLARFIADGVRLSAGDLVQAAPDGEEHWKDWSIVQPWLKDSCDDVGGQLIVHREPALDFVTDYLKMLSTGRLPISADKFLKAFANGARLREINSATDFVRSYILEKDDVKVAELRDSIKEYKGYARECRLLEEKLGLLRPLSARIEAYAKALHDRDVARWAEARAGAFDAWTLNRRYRLSVQHGLAEQQRIGTELNRIERERQELERERAEHTNFIRAASRTQAMTELELRRTRLEQDLKEVNIDIGRAFKAAVDAVSLLRDDTLIPPAFDRFRATLAELKTETGSDQPPQWPRDAEAAERLLTTLALDEERLSRVLEEAAERLGSEASETKRKQEAAQKQISDIRSRGYTIRQEVENLREELRRIGLTPRIVCEHLAVTDEGWRLAAEVLLGRDREAIIVEPGEEEAAIRHLQSRRRDYVGCRIVNTRKVPLGEIPTAGTLASVMASDDSVAMAFVLRRVGNVRLAETVADLHAPGRAVMRDGTYDDGLTVEIRQLGRRDSYKIGANAGRGNLADLEREAAALEGKAAELERDKKLHRAAAERLKGLSCLPPLRTAVDQAEHLRAALDEVAHLVKAEKADVDPHHEERLGEIELQLTSYREAVGELNKARGRAEKQVEDATKALGRGDSSPGSHLHLKRNVSAFRAVVRQMGPIRHIGGAARFAQLRETCRDDFGRMAARAAHEREELDKLAHGEGPEILNDYYAYARLDNSRPEFTSRDSILPTLQDWTARQIEAIEYNTLKEFRHLADQAEARARQYFQTAFINELRERFARVEEAIDGMTRALQDHPFHNERYEFRWDAAESHRTVWNLVQASKDDDTLLLPLFQEAAVVDGTPHGEALQKVRALLLDETFDVEAWSDYRDYFVFDMEMVDIATKRRTNLEKRQGTGSGAEQQTPTTSRSVPRSPCSIIAAAYGAFRRRTWGSAWSSWTRPSRTWTRRTSARPSSTMTCSVFKSW